MSQIAFDALPDLLFRDSQTRRDLLQFTRRPPPNPHTGGRWTTIPPPFEPIESLNLVFTGPEADISIRRGTINLSKRVDAGSSVVNFRLLNKYYDIWGVNEIINSDFYYAYPVSGKYKITARDLFGNDVKTFTWDLKVENKFSMDKVQVETTYHLDSDYWELSVKVIATNEGNIPLAVIPMAKLEGVDEDFHDLRVRVSLTAVELLSPSETKGFEKGRVWYKSDKITKRKYNITVKLFRPHTPYALATFTTGVNMKF